MRGRVLLGLIVLAIVSTMLNTSYAVKHKKQCCPKCSTPCVLKVSEGTESKHCWKIESKTICIPKVRFSWQWPGQKKKSCGNCDSSCDGTCGKSCCEPPIFGRSREICVLIKHEYECPQCKYSWEPKEKENCCDPIDSAGQEIGQPDPPAPSTARSWSAPRPILVDTQSVVERETVRLQPDEMQQAPQKWIADASSDVRRARPPRY